MAQDSPRRTGHRLRRAGARDRGAAPANGWLQLDVQLPAGRAAQPAGADPRGRARADPRRSASAIERIFVAYGDCGTGGELDACCARRASSGSPARIATSSLPTAAVFAALAEAEPGTFYLTDFCVRHFERLVIQGLGIDRHPELLPTVFRQLPQARLSGAGADAGARAQAQAMRRAWGWLRISLHRVTAGLARASAAMRRITRRAEASWPSAEHHLLARHSRPGDRQARPRDGQGAAVARASRKRSTAPPCEPARAAPMPISPSGSAARRGPAAMTCKAEAAAEAARIEARYTR